MRYLIFYPPILLKETIYSPQFFHEIRVICGQFSLWSLVLPLVSGALAPLCLFAANIYYPVSVFCLPLSVFLPRPFSSFCFPSSVLCVFCVLAGNKKSALICVQKTVFIRVYSWLIFLCGSIATKNQSNAHISENFLNIFEYFVSVFEYFYTVFEYFHIVFKRFRTFLTRTCAFCSIPSCPTPPNSAAQKNG
jgi:hypothetical protein